MERPNIIERAFSLAEKCGSIDEVKQQLKREGYLQVDAHLSGRQIRSEIMGRLSPQLVKGRRLSRAEKSENGS